MNIQRANDLVKDKIQQCISLGYSYWKDIDFPFHWEELTDDEFIQYEIVLLEEWPDYLHVMVALWDPDNDCRGLANDTARIYKSERHVISNE